MQSYFQREALGFMVNAPEIVAKVKDALPAPTSCPYCGGTVQLVNNAAIYGKSYGWPLTYLCPCCKAKVGCHNGTDIPLGTLADHATQKARMAAHAAFDPIWKNKGNGSRTKAYRQIASLMGIPKAHISWMDASACAQVVALCQSGKVKV